MSEPNHNGNGNGKPKKNGKARVNGNGSASSNGNGKHNGHANGNGNGHANGNGNGAILPKIDVAAILKKLGKKGPPPLLPEDMPKPAPAKPDRRRRGGKPPDLEKSQIEPIPVGGLTAEEKKQQAEAHAVTVEKNEKREERRRYFEPRNEARGGADASILDDDTPPSDQIRLYLLWCQGYRPIDIYADPELSAGRKLIEIVSILRDCDKYFKARHTDQVDQIKRRHLMAMQQIQRECFEGFERSKRPEITTKERESESSKDASNSTEKITKPRDGNPVWLQVAMVAMEQEERIIDSVTDLKQSDGELFPSGLGRSRKETVIAYTNRLQEYMGKLLDHDSDDDGEDDDGEEFAGLADGGNGVEAN